MKLTMIPMTRRKPAANHHQLRLKKNSKKDTAEAAQFATILCGDEATKKSAKVTVGGHTVQPGQKEEVCDMIRTKFGEIGWTQIKFTPSEDSARMKLTGKFLDLIGHREFGNIEEKSKEEQKKLKPLRDQWIQTHRHCISFFCNDVANCAQQQMRSGAEAWQKDHSG